MPLMRATTPIGRLFRQRRKVNRVSWKRLERATELEDETMMRWERGATNDPPLTKALLFAREVGISLDELVETALGEPWNGPPPSREEPMDAKTRAVIWHGLQAAWDRLAALQRLDMTDEVRAQIVETQAVIGASQKQLGLTAEQAAVFAETADATAEAGALRVAAREEDDPPPGEGDPGQSPSA